MFVPQTLNTLLLKTETSDLAGKVEEIKEIVPDEFKLIEGIRITE